MSVGPRAGKFNIVNDGHGDTQKYLFYLFIHLFIYLFIYLDWKYSFLGKLGPKNQTCQFKLKFGT